MPSVRATRPTRVIKAKPKIRTWAELRELYPVDLNRRVRLTIVRHGETEANVAGRITGERNVALTRKGWRQARAVAELLDSAYDVAYCSELTRAKLTLANALAQGRTNIDHIVYDARLNERSLGDYEQRPAMRIPQYASGNLNFAPPGGETYRHVAQRILSFLYDLSQSEVEDALIVSHMGPMRMLAGILSREIDPVKVLGMKFPNTELLQFKVDRLHFPSFIERKM